MRLSPLGDKLPHVKMFLLFACYMCSPENYEEVGLMYYANGIDKRKLEKLEDQEEHLIAAEEFLKHCFEGCQPQQRSIGLPSPSGDLCIRVEAKMKVGG